MNAYFSTMLHLAKLFGMVTLFALPIYWVYVCNETQFLDGRGSWWNKVSIGNMGGSSVSCSIQNITNTALNFNCPKGSIIKYDGFIHYGVMPRLGVDQDFCKSSLIEKDKCDDWVNKDWIHKQLKACKSKDKSACSIKFGEKEGEVNMFKDMSSAPKNIKDNCNSKSKFFMQVGCTIPEERMKTR